jgi:hypothetical protein
MMTGLIEPEAGLNVPFMLVTIKKEETKGDDVYGEQAGRKFYQHLNSS